MIRAALLAGLALLSVAAKADTIEGPSALAVAGVVAASDPALSPPGRRAVGQIFDGGRSEASPVTVTADAIVCRVSNVAIETRSCELDFGKRKVTLKGRAANELYATLAAAGAPSDGAAGSIFEAVKSLACTVNPAAIDKQDGSGAHCDYTRGP